MDTLKFKYLGIFGIISLLSYTAMVIFSPLAYPGHNWLSMAVSDLGAVGAPSAALAERINVLFEPCAVVSVMVVGVLVLIAIGGRKESLPSLSNWAIGCLTAMMIGALGTGILPKSIFGLFERFSTFSAVVFNAVLGVYLLKGAFPVQGHGQ